MLPNFPYRKSIIHQFGRYFSHSLISKYLEAKYNKSFQPSDYDLLWVNQDRLIPPNFVRHWTQHKPSVMYINDNPFVDAFGRIWDLLRRSLTEFTLVAVKRVTDVEAATKLGCKNVRRIWMTYDEIVHAPVEETEEDRKTWGSDVAFIGTFMEGRDKFLAELIQRGVPLTIYGSNWPKSALWMQLKDNIHPRMLQHENYVKGIQYAKICLGLLCKDNLDLHTRRDVEVPFIGTLFCCERTSEHQYLYAEDEEAVMWDDAAECADKCLRLLDNPHEIERISRNGRRKVLDMKVGNESLGAYLVAETLKVAAQQ